MGLIRAALGSAGGVLADQWREYFYCESLPENVLAEKGQKRTSRRSSNRRGSDNIITNGSVIAVADGQCMIIVDQGKVAEICAEPGEFVYDSSTEPTVFYGGFGKGLLDSFKELGKRFTFGGEPAKDQRVYYFNTKELVGNKYGTPSPVPFRVVDQRAGIDIDVSIRCFGEYSYHICNPILFYTNVCGNVTEDYTRDRLDGQLKTELLTALQPAFAKISEMGIRYSALPGHTAELADALNEVLSNKWRNLRGIEIVSFGVSSVKATDEDEQMIKEMQRNAAFRDPTMAAAYLTGAQGAAMQAAAKNEGAGPAMAFMGMNMAGQAGGNIGNLYQMGAQQQANQSAMGYGQQPGGQAGQPQNAAGGMQQNGQGAAQNKQPEESWTCPSCGETGNTGKFCHNCGKPRPVATADGWVCPDCGTLNKGKFCSNCGHPKPAGVPKYKCDKCGWEPEDPTHPPKFCPNCGDPFDENDRQ